MIPVLPFELVRELPRDLQGRGFVPGRVIRGSMRRWNRADAADVGVFAAAVADLIRRTQRGGAR